MSSPQKTQENMRARVTAGTDQLTHVMLDKDLQEKKMCQLVDSV